MIAGRSTVSFAPSVRPSVLLLATLLVALLGVLMSSATASANFAPRPETQITRASVTGSASGDAHTFDGANHAIDVFANQRAPVVVGESSANVTSSQAELSGEIDPESPEIEYWFEYGERGTYTEKTATLKSTDLTGPVHAGPVTITDLSPAVTYSYRLVAKNAAGEAKDMENKTFTTEPVPPSVIGESVSEVTEDGATLQVQIDPGGEATYYAEYGTNPCGDNTCGMKTSEGFLIGDTPQQGTLFAGNLKPRTTYHYWVVAMNSAAPAGVHGEAKEFTTPRSWEEIRREEDEQFAKQRAQEEAKAKAELEARTAAAAKEHQEEEAAAAAKKRQEDCEHERERQEKAWLMVVLLIAVL